MSHHAFCADVSNSGSVQELVQNVRAAFSSLPTVAVNSAGITRDTMMLKMSEEMYDKVLNVNLKVNRHMLVMILGLEYAVPWPTLGINTHIQPGTIL